MNNPADHQFMMSPMSRPPAAKKQRGGATPRPAPPTSSSAAVGPPPSGPLGSRSSYRAAEDAIARRRAELRRLQAKRAGVSAASAAAAASRGSAKPPPPSSTAPPMKPAGVGRHYSDLFPTVPKSPSPMVSKQTLLQVSAGAAAAVPVLVAEPTELKQPAVNRKLEFDRSRAKSAPRERRPPPPPPPPPKGTIGVAGAPPTTAAAARPGSAKPLRSTATAARPGGVTLKASSPEKKKKEQAPKTPHLIPSSKSKTVSGLGETTPEPADLLKPKKLPVVVATPYPGKVATASPTPSAKSSSSSKREKINALRNQVEKADGAAAVLESGTTSTTKNDEPPTPPRRPARSPPEQMTITSATEKRLEEAYNKAENEKTAALIKIKELEDKLLVAQEASTKQSLPPPGTSENFDVSYLFTLAERDGPVAAVEWAKTAHNASELLKEGNVPSSTPAKQSTSIAFAATPQMVGLETPVRRRISSRTLTPHPKMLSGADPSMPPAQVEYQKREHFKEAAQIVPFEFSSKLATFTVRRPYGLPSNPELFAYASPMLPDQQYWKGAHVSTLSALEVAVTIHADNSVLLLFDVAGVRYKINSSNSEEWAVIPNVDDMMDRPNLGHVSYIDEQANELEYSLDEILEEALLVREQYASNVTNMAFGLEQRPAVAAPALPKSPTQDAAVETDEKGMTTDVPKNIQVDNAAGHKTKQAPPAEDAHSGSSDVLTMFFGWILSSIVGLIYYIVIGLPLKIVQTIFILTVAYALFQMAYFYLAQDYNEWIIQENGGSVTASDLVYFFNTRNGIM